MIALGKNVCIRAKWLYLSKTFLFGQIGCIWAKVVVFEQIGYIWEKLVVFGQNCCARAKWLYLEKKRLYSGKLVVFGKNWLY